jgi:hypothetical protein
MRFESVTRSNNTVKMSFSGYPNVSYTVERATALGNNRSSTAWTTLTNFPASSVFGMRQATDVVPANETRFYQIQSQ